MPLLEWDPSYEIGDPVIDGDHRTMVTLVNDLHGILGSGVSAAALADLFERMIEHTDGHFVREETLMEQQNFHRDRLLEQRFEHRLLGERLRELKSRLDTGDSPQAVGEDLLEFLVTWFKGHILEEDMKFKPFLARS